MPNKKSKKPNYLVNEGEVYNTARGEAALWAAVITQALMDAQSKCKKPESRYHKHEAICWLTGGSKDFIDVCLSAGLDPDYVRRRAKKAIASPTNWRAEAGKGKRYEERKKYREKMREEARKKAENLKEPASAQILKIA